MAVSECDTYINTIGIVANNINDVADAIDVIEDRIIDNDKFPVVKDNKIKTGCHNSYDIGTYQNCDKIYQDEYRWHPKEKKEH